MAPGTWRRTRPSSDPSSAVDLLWPWTGPLPFWTSVFASVIWEYNIHLIGGLWGINVITYMGWLAHGGSSHTLVLFLSALRSVSQIPMLVSTTSMGWEGWASKREREESIDPLRIRDRDIETEFMKHRHRKHTQLTFTQKERNTHTRWEVSGVEKR